MGAALLWAFDFASAGKNEAGGAPDRALHALHAAHLRRGLVHVGGESLNGRFGLAEIASASAEPLHDRRPWASSAKIFAGDATWTRPSGSASGRLVGGMLPADDPASGVCAAKAGAQVCSHVDESRVEDPQHRVPAGGARGRRAAGQRPHFTRIGLQRERRGPDVLLHRQSHRRTAHRTVLGLDRRRDLSRRSRPPSPAATSRPWRATTPAACAWCWPSTSAPPSVSSRSPSRSSSCSSTTATSAPVIASTPADCSSSSPWPCRSTR